MASEEHKKLCLNKCGFFGSESTGNLCSSCYRNQQCLLQLNTLSPPTSSSSTPTVDADMEMLTEMTTKKKKKSCTKCGKRLRILREFRCRCNNTYCSAHRYPEDHSCRFDFKAAGRVLIERNNPIVKAEKLAKI